MELKMAEQKKTQQPPKTQPPKRKRLTTEEKGLPPVDYSPPTPPVKPPKEK